MSGEFDAAGTAIEGALIAKAVESESGDSPSKKGGECLNCKAIVTGSFCSNCGQPLHIHRSIAAIWHDLLHGVLHFEGKIWRTLPMLAFKPGQLTRRYIRGERSGFVSPMALFLFSIFLMFAVFAFIGTNNIKLPEDATYVENLEIQDAKLIEKLEQFELELAAPTLTSADREKIEEELVKLKHGRNGLSYARAKPIPYPELNQNPDSPIQFSNDGEIDTGSPYWDKTLNDALKKAQTNPSLLLYKLQSNGYKFAWLLIPLSLPFVWLTMFGKRGYKLYDHAIFTTYSISFMSLLFIFVAVLGSAGFGGIVGPIAALVPPLHLYKHLRHSYGLSRLETLIRLVVLLIGVVLSLTFFLLILFLLGLLG
ncbi:MAG: DUF3667 domain-containing protein [Parasphingorhabdus sp.]|uniref:DUF3667 domain-containing protein n=1 Tax=Parasphingorhabdus sp. TaxID=2709688 RepID=UPI0032982355